MPSDGKLNVVESNFPKYYFIIEFPRGIWG